MATFDESIQRSLDEFLEKHASNSEHRKVALFDADGTLWRGDVGEDFFKNQIREGTAPHAPARHPWDAYFSESVHGDTAKAFAWLAQWNAGVEEKQLIAWADAFFEKHYRNRIFKPMQEFAQKLSKAGFELWVISGSIRWVVASGAKHFGIPPERVLGTAVQVKDGLLTDALAYTVPFRHGKAVLVEEKVKTKPLFAAGNTYWDKELLLQSTDIALAINTEKFNEVNYESEQKLKAFAESQATSQSKVKWLCQTWSL